MWTGTDGLESTLLNPASLFVNAVALGWHASDFSTSITTTTHSLRATAASSTLFASTSASDTGSTLPRYDAKHFTNGEIVGVVVGALAASMVLVCICTQLLKCLRTRRERSVESTRTHSELFARIGRRSSRRADTAEVHELRASATRAEADGLNVRAELESDWQGNEPVEK